MYFKSIYHVHVNALKKKKKKLPVARHWTYDIARDNRNFSPTSDMMHKKHSLE